MSGLLPKLQRDLETVERLLEQRKPHAMHALYQALMKHMPRTFKSAMKRALKEHHHDGK